MAQQAVVYITGSEWVSGGCDGSLQVSGYSPLLVHISGESGEEV
jgi:hypothetical protein